MFLIEDITKENSDDVDVKEDVYEEDKEVRTNARNFLKKDKKEKMGNNSSNVY